MVHSGPVIHDNEQKGEIIRCHHSTKDGSQFHSTMNYTQFIQACTLVNLSQEFSQLHRRLSN